MPTCSRTLAATLLSPLFLLAPAAHATIFGSVQGVVHDPQHRPLAGATLTLESAGTAVLERGQTAADGSFHFPAVPLGDYTLAAASPGFGSATQRFTVHADSTPVLHFELSLAPVQQSATVTALASGLDPDSATPTTLVREQDIAETPGAALTQSLAMITDYVPGAYITHDMLHMRGGHQVAWLIDGVEIPNTNIASNLGPQIDPKDIQYLQTSRGSYSADLGDRTYGIFDVVPKNGFARTHDAELTLTGGSFLQTDDQLALGSHTARFAYYGSLEGDRSDYGLSTPTGEVLHDASNGFGGFASLLFNQTPRDQLRFVAQLRRDFFQIPYDPDPNSQENQLYNSSGLRDAQTELDGLSAFTWVRTFSPTTVLQLAPFFHYNAANYNPNAADQPVATTSDRGSTYGGLQASLGREVARNSLQGGVYSFGQRDSTLFRDVFNDSSFPSFALAATAAGGLAEEWLADNYHPLPGITILGGLRASQFRSALGENYVTPRIGLALEVPKLHWVFRGFYGRFYQPPPLLTAAGPLVTYAQAQNTTLVPLHGERDEEHQFGVQIPLPGSLQGWLVDADTFQTRANNFLDHSNIGESSIYVPVTVEGALIQGWELTLRSPRLPHDGQAHLAYSNQIAQQRGPITGGLICYPVTSPECDVAPGYTPVDHDQRNTLNFGYRTAIPFRAWAATNIYYGSGFTNGNQGSPDDPYPGAYLPQHTTFDLAFGRSVGENATLAVNATNVGNRRVLLDNSLTFGGFHYNDPRRIYGELRFRFHY